MTISSVSDALDRIAPRQVFVPNWDDVVVRAGATKTAPDARRSRYLSTRRRVALALGAIAAVLIPLAALAAANEWWFFRFGGAPMPATEVVVVRTESWDGYDWQLVAYRSTRDEVCFSFTPAGVKVGGTGAAMSCGVIEPGGITFLAGSVPHGPSYMIGPVAKSAQEVNIHFTNGQIVRTKTFNAPASLGNLRFYATRVPESVQPLLGRVTTGPSLEKLVGLDADGNIVACLSLPMPTIADPFSPCQ